MNPARQISQRKKVRTALERIDALEKTLERMAAVFDMVLNQRLSPILESVEALCAITGPEEVAKMITDARKRKAEEQAEAAKKGLEEALAAGKMVPVEVCSEKSVIVGRLADENDKAIGLERSQVHISQISPQYRDQILGKGVGTKIEGTSDDGKKSYFTVLELYDPVPQPPNAEAPTAQAAESADDGEAAADIAAQLAAELGPAEGDDETVTPQEVLQTPEKE